MAPIIERAFDLAASGQCPTMQDLAKRLRDEGYTGVAEHLQGPAIRKQLGRLMAEARRKRMPAVESSDAAESEDA